MHTGVLVA